jgi:hypothetical protein
VQTQPSANDVETPDPAALTRALDDIARRVAATYPAAAPERIASLLRACYERTRDAKVQQYRLVLAERDTRLQMRLDQRAAASMAAAAPLAAALSEQRELTSTA